MKRLCANLFCWLVLPSASLAAPPARPPHSHTSFATRAASAPPSGDIFLARYSKEPYVIEKYTTVVRFEDNGTQTRTVTARIRIQSTVAAHKFSILVFSYNSSIAQLQFRSVRVVKPDGTQRNASPDAVTEVPAAITRDAPAYATTYKDKSIAVPALEKGDTLEYEVVNRTRRAQASGEFWMQHTFLADAIVLRDSLEVDVPKSRRVNLKSLRFPYSTDAVSSSSRIIYRWSHANLIVPPADELADSASQHAKAKPADVELTTFASWDAVSHWYDKLQRTPEESSSAEIRAKAAELAGNRGTDLQKMQALYDYVSKNIRYVDLTFGTAGYEPRSAAQVLASKYGDGADKHILLASMLEAVGIHCETALIPDSRRLDASLPSPAQFTHVLTAVPLGNRLIWLDSTSEVAPFRFLPAAMREKPALLISSDGSGKIVETPQDPPFLSTQHVDIEGRVSDLGNLRARIRYELRGDNEYILRLAFHRTPQTQWKDLAQTVLALDGVHGQVDSVNPGDPSDTENPFVLDIEYWQPNLFDWSSQETKVAMPLLAIGMPDAPKEGTSDTFELGSPLEVTAQLKLTFPENFTPRPPVAVVVSRDYAAFKSNYHFENHTLTAERSLDFKMRALPSSRAGEYVAFSRAVAADQSQSLLVENATAGALAIPPAATAGELFDAGTAALASGNTRSSIPLLERLVDLEPTYREAWNQLGLSYMRAGQFDRASTAFEKQLEMNPSHPQARNYLGLVLQQQQKYDEAAFAFRKQTEMNPLDTVAHGALGAIYLSQREYAQAVPELDKAAVLSPDNAELLVSLGQAYINLGQNEKALAAFDRAVELSPKPVTWSDVAYSLAEHKLELAKALKYAESAVAAAAADLQNIDLAHVSAGQFDEEASLVNYWDTLGRVYFQKGDLDSAEGYIRSAWLSNQRGETAGHLAQIQERRGQKDEAIHTYALALAAHDADPEPRARLTLLLGGNSEIDGLVDQIRPALAALRTVPVGKIQNKTAEAQVLVLLSPAAGRSHSAYASAVRFLAGSDELRSFADRLRTIDFGPVFPDSSLPKLARRGALTCLAATGECFFTLFPLESRHAAY